MTEVVPAVSAVLAGVAGDTWLQSHTVSDCKALYIASALDHNSCRFVAENDGVFNDVSTYSAMLPVVYLSITGISHDLSGEMDE